MEDYDLILARQLQEEFDKETVLLATPSNNPRDNYSADNVHSNSGLSVIDPSWETTDPNPDVLALFTQFDRQYFWGKLAGVEVKWSPRMTLCAGVCSYEGRGGLCSIRLSVPLLKLRPRKDLVETLLHEMIHAYLFVTENDRDRDGHGPNFKKHMYRINKASGANITIYHDFHDEVDNYRQHWWRCNGPCQKRPPFYGWVKRAMNRAPSPQDFWWPDHQRSCGGTYTKIKEPEGYGAKKKSSKDDKKDSKVEQKNSGMDIRAFLGKGNALDNSGQSNKPTISSSNVKSVTATTNPTSSQTSSKNGSVASATGKTVGGKEPTNNTKTVLSDGIQQWTGGIWTPEKNSELSSDFQTSTNPVQKKTWTVMETGKDKEGKLDSRQCEKTGHVLGSDSSGGLNWLARMRKQWESNGRDCNRPSTSISTELAIGTFDSSKQQHTGQQTAKPSGSNHQTDLHSKPEKVSLDTGTKQKSTVNPDVLGEAVSLSDNSFHDSFHVSSCEEDNWPTPETYKYKGKTSSSCQSKRKRIVLDFTSSDEEDTAVPVVSKRLKLPENLKRSSSESDSDDAHLQDGIKSSSSMKTDSSYEHFHHNDASISNPTSSDTGGSSVRNPAEISFVDCPSCQKSVLAKNINVHLDTCLL